MTDRRPNDSDLVIRDSVADDTASIESLYPQGFPDEDLLPLVRELLQAPGIARSLVATIGSEVAGHIIFTTCSVAECNVKAALLGPLVVAPAWQRRGIGGALVRAGMQRMQNDDVVLVCVLGDPEYYGRLGFNPETRVAPPYRLPDEWAGAWQSRYAGGTEKLCTGRLSVPALWRQPDLWAP